MGKRNTLKLAVSTVQRHWNLLENISPNTRYFSRTLGICEYNFKFTNTFFLQVLGTF